MSQAHEPEKANKPASESGVHLGQNATVPNTTATQSTVEGKMGRRIVLIMILLSGAITLLTTLVQLYWDYEQKFNSVGQRHEEIESIHASSLASSLWNFDLVLLQERLDGLVNLPSVDYLQINSGSYEFKAGTRAKLDYVADTYPLIYFNADNESNESIGTLYIETNTQEIYAYLVHQFIVTLGLNTVKTALVCYLILVIFNISINQRISAIAKFLGRYNPEKPGPPLKLSHPKLITEKYDELYWLADKTNEITQNVTNLYDGIKYEKSRLSDFTEVSSDWLWETNERNHFIYCSESMAEALQIDPEHSPHIRSVPILAQAHSLMQALARRNHFSMCEETLEINGVRHYLLFQGKPQHIDDKFIGFRGTTIDITELKLTQLQLEELNQNLERTVAVRTLDLKQSKGQLQSAQDQLIESEKLAALGGLVAGVAHEVNTPLGISVTATSVVKDAVNDLNHAFESKTLTTAQFEDMMETLNEGVTMLEHNLSRAAKLVRDFKQTAVDQVSEARSEFNLKNVLDALIASLHPETRHVPVTPEITGEESLIMNSLPGVVTQIITNLVLNSVIHAFEEQTEPAQIAIDFHCENNDVILEYRDNGAGINSSLHQKIFEPFFTSKRGKGGSGLGLNLVFNLVSQKLGGQLAFESEAGKGVHFTITLPKELTMDKIPEE